MEAVSAINVETLVTSLLLFITTGLLGWLVKLVKDYRKEWNVRAKDVEAMRRAMLGSEGDEWSKAEAGLLAKVEDLRRNVGHNGGSSLFDGQDELKHGQAVLMRWATQHTIEAEQSDPHTKWTRPFQG